MTGRVWLLSALAFALFLTAFLFRTAGIHIDEIGYLTLALETPFGDALFTAKPYLFYALNYGLIHSIGLLFGPLRPISLQVFYMACLAVSVAWTAVLARPGESMSEAVFRVSIVSLSALALLNATTLMMESAAFVAMTLTLGCIMARDSTRASRSGLVVMSAVSTAIKSTTIPGLILLAWAFHARLRGRALLIPAGVAVGLAANAVGLWLLAGHGDIGYGGPRALLSLQTISARLPRAGRYFTLWLVFVGATLAVAALADRSRTLKNRQFQVLAVGSPFAVFLLQLASTFEFARYCYPVMWAALAGVVLTADMGKGVMAVSLLALQLVVAAPLFMRSIDRFRFWPQLVTGEMINSGGTVFPGLPIYGLVARQLLFDRQPCVWINADNGEKNEVLERFARLTFLGGEVVVSPRFDPQRDRGCSPSNTVRMWREHVSSPSAGCNAACGTCEFQYVEYFSSTPGWLRNQVCWPTAAILRP